jgi:hypothetical protein
MADDFHTFSARQRLQQISAARAQSLADLEQCKAKRDALLFELISLLMALGNPNGHRSFRSEP